MHSPPLNTSHHKTGESLGCSQYDRFASIYNRQFGHFAGRVVPVLERLLLRNLPERASILDVCCGTGQLAAILFERGLDVFGVDGSAEMLRFASQNAPAASFHLEDVRTMRLPGAFDAAVSTFDSLNHLLNETELTSTLTNVCNALRPGGLFIFDLNMEEGFRWRWWGSQRGVEDGRDYVIRAVYCPQTKLGHNVITFLDPLGESQTDFRIAERCYSEDEVRRAAAAAGFEAVQVYDGHSDLDLFGEIGRSFFVCYKTGDGQSPVPAHDRTVMIRDDPPRQRQRSVSTCASDGLWPSGPAHREIGAGSQRLRAVEEVLCRLPVTPYESLRQQASGFDWFIPSASVLGQVHPFRAGCVARLNGQPGPPYSRIVYLSPLLEQHAWQVVVTVVAHELAHLVLGHELFDLTAEKYKQQEDEVGKAVREWGFRTEADQADDKLRVLLFEDLCLPSQAIESPP